MLASQDPTNSLSAAQWATQAAGPSSNTLALMQQQQLLQQQNLLTPQVAHYLQLQALSRLQQQQQLFAPSIPRPLVNLSYQQAPLAGFIDPRVSALGQFPMGHYNLSLMRQRLQQGGFSSLPTLGGHAIATDLNLNSVNALGMHGAAAPQPPIQGGIPNSLPVILACPEDTFKLSSHQVLLRHQIEAFQASEEDISTHTRGRNKPIVLRQVGIRCRHCAHLPVSRRQKGSTYFPATLLGIYQAAQNMSTTHMQCGLCSEMPDSIKAQFVQVLSAKVASSGAGRPYWAESATKLGLVDTENGIMFIRDLPPGARILSAEA